MEKLTKPNSKDGFTTPPTPFNSEEMVTLAIAAILFEVDPCLINFGENTGEYIVEADCFASKLKRCQSMNQMKTIIDKTLNRYFSKNWGTYNRNTKNSVLLLQWLDKYGSLKITNHAHYTY